jgi:ethanolamine utilization protein EutJ
MEPNPSSSDLLADFNRVVVEGSACREHGPIHAGVDLGTANIVTALVNAEGRPIGGALTRSASSIRDGLVLDYMGAITILRRQVQNLQAAGFPVKEAMAAFPPGTTGRNSEAFANVLRACGLEVVGLLDEPSSAALVLGIDDGCVVDIGGGTTGISVLENGRVIYTADEATGGIHLDLVIAGNFKISTDEAERLKNDPGRQTELFPLIRPVFQKMAGIVSRHIRGYRVETLYMVGGTCCFPGIEEVMAAETGLNVVKPDHPLLVTPLGIALGCRQGMTGSQEKKAGRTHG